MGRGVNFRLYMMMYTLHSMGNQGVHHLGLSSWVWGEGGYPRVNTLLLVQSGPICWGHKLNITGGIIGGYYIE